MTITPTASRRLWLATVCIALGGAALVLLLLSSTRPTSAAAATAAPTARVINGTKVTPVDFSSRWPWIGALVMRAEPNAADGQICGVSLIGPQTAVTAAHCVTTWDDEHAEISIIQPTTFDVVLGRSRLSDAGSGQRIHVTGVTVKPQFDDELLTSDVALLTLATAPVGITPISIVGAGETAWWGGGTGLPYTPATGPWAAGWGERSVVPSDLFGSGGGDVYPDNLFEVPMPIVSDAVCEDGGPGAGIGHGRYLLVSDHLCAGTLDTSDLNDENATNNGTSACYGDSGGPLIVSDGATFRLAGITSWGRACADRQTYSVFTRLDAMRAWIQSNPPLPVRNLSAPTLRGRGVRGTMLTCDKGAWSGGGAITYTYHWERFKLVRDARGNPVDVSINRLRIRNSRLFWANRKRHHWVVRCRVTASNASWTVSRTTPFIGIKSRREMTFGLEQLAGVFDATGSIDGSEEDEGEDMFGSTRQPGANTYLPHRG